MIFAGKGFANPQNTVAVAKVESPHNEKPIGEFRVDLLKQAIETAENLDQDSVFLWGARALDESNDTQALALTESRDSDVGIGVAPMVSRE